MAAGLGFKDFTTGEVLTAADVDGYLMQGVWVFASATARDAAVTSPQEGNFAYLKDTNVTTYYTGSAWANLDTTGMTNPMTTTGDTIYSSSGSTPARLGIGSTGQVLTVAGGVPSWSTPAGGGGMTLLNSGSEALSGLSTITINITDSSYTNLEIQINGVVTSTSSCNIAFRLNGDTGSNYISRYFRSAGNAGTVSGGRDAANVCYFGSAGNQSGYEQLGRQNLRINNYSSTGYKMMYGNHTASEGAGPTVEWRNLLLSWNNTAAITSFTYLISTGTWTAGTIRVYGVK